MTPSHERNPESGHKSVGKLERKIVHGRGEDTEVSLVRSGKVWSVYIHVKATRMSIQAWVIHMKNSKPHSRQRVTEVPATVNTMYILVNFGTLRTMENL